MIAIGNPSIRLADFGLRQGLAAEVKFTPLFDFVLIEPIPKGTTEGGLALPAGADPDPPKGKVVKVGPGRMTEEGAFIEPTVHPGDVVYLHFAYSKPISFTVGGKDYMIARCRDLIGLAT